MNKQSVITFVQPTLLAAWLSVWLTPALAWQPLATGVNGAVKALAINSAGTLFVGGDFTSAGSVSASYIAQWDGATWGVVGSGNELTAATNALAVNNTDLYVGGAFSGHIQKWNGSAWSLLNSGVNGNVNALGIDTANNKLYVGGAFTSVVGGDTANQVAVWSLTNSTWSALDAQAFDAPVKSLAVDGVGNVLVGGAFTTLSGSSAQGLMQWTGSAWTTVGSGNNFPFVGVSSGNFDGSVNALAFKSALSYGSSDYISNLYVGGTFTNIANAGTQLGNNVAEWTGTAVSSDLNSVLDASNNNGVNGTVNALVLDSTTDPFSRKLYVGGAFTTIDASLVAKGAARFGLDTNQWSRLGGDGTDGPALVNALAVDQDGNVYAGGEFSSVGKNSAGTAISASNIAVYTSTELLANQWKLVSLPHYDASATHSSVFDSLPASSYNVAGDPRGWVVYDYDPNTDKSEAAIWCKVKAIGY